MESFKTIKQNNMAQLIEKKSKFIANVFYVEKTQEALDILSSIKKQYKDATHNCYAYNILEEGSIISKSSDDGEPARNGRSTSFKCYTEK